MNLGHIHLGKRWTKGGGRSTCCIDLKTIQINYADLFVYYRHFGGYDTCGDLLLGDDAMYAESVYVACSAAV